jgi:hypothetical protein
LIRGLKAAEARVASWGKTITKIGAGIAAIGGGAVATGLAAAHSFAEMGSELAGVAQRTGMTVEALSELQSKISVEDLELGFRHLQRAIFEAGEGSVQARDALGRFGLTAEQLQALSPDQQLALLADRFQAVRNPAERAGLAMSIFGRHGTELIKVLEHGSAGIEEVRARSRELGLGWSTEDANAAKKLAKETKLLSMQFQALTAQIGAAVAPVLRRLIDLQQQVLAPVIRWTRENRGLVTTIFLVAGAVVALGTAVAAFGGFVILASAALGGLATVLGVVGSLLGLILSPWVLIPVAIVGAAAALIYFTGNWDRTVSFFRETLAGLGDYFATVWGGIADAISAGDLELALRVAAAGLNVAWVALTGGLEVAWVAFVETLNYWWNWLLTTLQNGWTAGVGGLALLIAKGLGELEVFWFNFTVGLRVLWRGFLQWLEFAWLATIRNVVAEAAFAEAMVTSRALTPAGRLAEARAARQGAQAGIDQQLAGIGAGNEVEDRRIGQERRDLQARNLRVQNQLVQDMEAEIRQREQALAALEAEAAARIDAAQGELADNVARARAELDAVRAEAAQRRAWADYLRAKPQLEAAVGGLVGLGASAAAGTFSAAAAAGMAGGQSPEQQTAQNTARVAAGVQQLVNAANNGGLVFA